MLFCLNLTVTTASATGFRLEASTAIDSWSGGEDFGFSDGSGTAISHYLSAHVSGRQGPFRLEADAYGRATAASGEGGESGGRVYSFLVTASLEDAFSAALGRQEIPCPTGPVYLDGLRLRGGAGRYRLLGRWGLLADLEERGDGGSDRHLGIGLEADLTDGMILALDYARSTRDDRLLSELLATDWTYSWFRNTTARALFNYDLMSETLHDALVGARLFFSESFTLEVEYNQKVQTFDSDSIYCVFAVDAPETTSFSLLFTPSATVRYAWEYALESYGEGSGGRRYGVSGTWSPGTTRIEAGLNQHKGYGGSLTEANVETSFRLVSSLDIGIGGEATRSRNEDDTETVSSYAAHLRAQWAPAPKARLTLSFEQSGDDAGEEPERSGRLTFSTEL